MSRYRYISTRNSFGKSVKGNVCLGELSSLCRRLMHAALLSGGPRGWSLRFVMNFRSSLVVQVL